jgi:hypothetical protein
MLLSHPSPGPGGTKCVGCDDLRAINAHGTALEGRLRPQAVPRPLAAMKARSGSSDDRIRGLSSAGSHFAGVAGHLPGRSGFSSAI